MHTALSKECQVYACESVCSSAANNFVYFPFACGGAHTLRYTLVKTYTHNPAKARQRRRRKISILLQFVLISHSYKRELLSFVTLSSLTLFCIIFFFLYYSPMRQSLFLF